MCGLAGFLVAGGFQASSEHSLQQMLAAIAHRGPDGRGEWLDHEVGIALGSCRLAILDLSPLGHMPMVSATGRFVIAYNGEIYNFADLRQELEHIGHAFRGHSDTEVLLAAIECWGLEAAITRSVGMFAFALWDRINRTLSLVRDRVGEKPLYWARFGRMILFASELKGLRSFSDWHPAIDRGALALFLRYGYIPAPHTIFSHTHKVPPATILTFTSDATLLSEKVYWSAKEVAEQGFTMPLQMSRAETLGLLEQSLRRTIRQQMVADVPVGAFLSGGYDSSLVVALMQAESSLPVRTFTIGFNEPDLNEAKYAKAVADHLRTDHTELYLTAADALSLIPRLPAVYDEPFADSSQIPTLLVASLARSQVTVSLSGDGGDELFGGYSRYHWGTQAWGRLRRIPGPLRIAASRVISWAPKGFWNGITRPGSVLLPHRLQPPLLEQKLRAGAFLLLADSQESFYLHQMSHWQDPLTAIKDASEPSSLLTDPGQWADVDHSIARMMCADLCTYLPDDILVKVDRATMAVSLEARAPFLDHRIVELAWQIPMQEKVSTTTGKLVLKQLLARYVPPSLTDRPKMGFGIPLDEWLRGPLFGWADDLLERGNLLRGGLLDPDMVQRVWRDHLAGHCDHSYALWNVLVFQAWSSHWSGATGSQTPVHTINCV